MVVVNCETFERENLMDAVDDHDDKTPESKSGGDGPGPTKNHGNLVDIPLGKDSEFKEQDLLTRDHKKFLGMRIPNLWKNRVLSMAQAAILLLNLYLSLMALRLVSVPLYVVARNCIPLQTAILEYLRHGTLQKKIAYIGLMIALAGATLFVLGDYLHGGHGPGPASHPALTHQSDGSKPTSHSTGTGPEHSSDFNFDAHFARSIITVILLTMTIATATVVDKEAVHSMATEGISPVEINQLRVSIVLPFNFLLAYTFDMAGTFLSTSCASCGIWETSVKFTHLVS